MQPFHCVEEFAVASSVLQILSLKAVDILKKQ